MIRCLAVDDETPALDILEDNIRRIPSLQLVRRCKNAFEAMEVMQHESIDLLFLDVQMPRMMGTDFLRGLSLKPMVIFITAYKKYAVDGFDLDVLDYLIKPVAFDRFLKAVNKAIEYKGLKQIEENRPNHFPDYFFVHSGHQLTKIFFHEISYIEGLRNYVKIFMTGTTKPIFSKLSLKALEQKLPPSNYARVHKSFIVMMDKIQSIRNDDIWIGDKKLPLSRSYREKFLKKIDDKKIIRYGK